MSAEAATTCQIRTSSGRFAAAPGHTFLVCAKCGCRAFFPVMKGKPGEWQTAGFVCADASCGHIIKLED